MPKKMPVINECEMINCAYNQQRICHAMAITVGDGACPMCDTFLDQPGKGGVGDMKGGVGACRVTECQFNDSLECSASSIRVANHSSHPDCGTYRHR